MALTPHTPLPVTLDDVRAALGDTDPSATNAGKLRAAIGRGGMGTIQRHLDTIRSELRAAALQPLTAGTVPPMPADTAAAVAGLWSQAYAAAETLLRRRLDAVTAERDALAADVAERQADALAMADDLDAAEARATSVAAAAAAEALKADEATRVAQARTQALAEALQAAEQHVQAAEQRVIAVHAQAEHAAQLAAAQHAAELQRVEHDRLVERQALQAALDRAGERHAEALGLLHALRPAPVVPAQPQG